MTAAEDSRFRALADAAARPAGAERERAIENAVYHEVLAADGDEVTRQRVRAEVKRLGLMPLQLFDAVARRARADAADFAADGPEDGGAAPGVAVIPSPEGICDVPGSPGWKYAPAVAELGRQGELWKCGRNPVRVLDWVPAVARRLMTPGAGGAATAIYYEITAGAASVIASADELASGEAWRLLPDAYGTGAKSVREVLANVVQAEGRRCELSPALARTGWHAPEDGARFYVFADGRASDGRAVTLLGANSRTALAAAARPLPGAELADAAAIAEALGAVADHGHGAGLAGVGIGVRSLANSLHRVPGGYIAVGKPNAGKSSLGWHARCVIVAREGRADAWPPLPSATFADTRTSIEGALDYEADMPALIDDAALTDQSSRAEVAEVTARLEMVFRSYANEAAIRGRMDRTMLPRESRLVRGVPVATVQGGVADVPVQNSLLRRVLLLPIARGDIDTAWYRANAASLVAPLRALGEHLVIAYLAALGDGAAGYVAGKDGEARRMLGAALDRLMPGWEESAEGLAGVADIAACALSGVLIACELAGLAPELAECVALPYLAAAVAEQAERMGDSAEAASPGEALADILAAALLDRRAHVRNDQGDPWPVIEGLTEQEQGLRPLGAGYGAPAWEGLGVPLYWLPEDGAFGVRNEGLHVLLRRARAAGDNRIPAKPAQTLPSYLIAEGLAVPSSQRTGGKGIHQKWIAGGKKRLVLLPAHMLASAVKSDGPEGGRGGRGGRPQAGGDDSNADGAEALARGGRPQVTSGFAPPVEGDSACSDIGADRASTAPTASPGTEAVEPAARRTSCEACGEALHPSLIASGAAYHVMCAPDAPPAARPATAPRPPAVGGEGQGAELAEARPAPVAEGAAAASSAPRRRWVVLGGDGRAYASGGEIITLPEGALAKCPNAGELAAVALALGAERCYVPAAARQALGLPATLPDAKPTEGHPHMWTESTDPAAWDIWPNAPVGLSSWMVVYRMPSTLREGTAIVFPEWLPNTPALGELAAPELARALELIGDATRHPSGGGGVEFHRSPASTFGRLLDKAARYSRTGRREAVELPPPYDRKARMPRGAPASLRAPGSHMAPPAEVPAGWVVARLDVRSCFASAATGTDFGVGEAVHSKGGELGKAPGAHLVRVPAGACAHPSLTPLVPAGTGKAREVLAWVDTLAARWLAECGVPVEVVESWTWPEKWRVFDSALGRLADARARLEAAGGVPELAAAAVVKSMANAYLGGRLTSDYEGNRSADDWTWRADWWLTIRVQAEVRKQRNLLPALASGAVVVLGSQKIDSVYVAAPELGGIEAMPGTGGRLAVAGGRGKFKIEAHAAVTAELAAVLADKRGTGHARLAAVKHALGEGK